MKSLVLGSMGLVVSMVLGGCAANTEGVPAPVSEPAPTQEVGSKAPATPGFDAKGDVALPVAYGEQVAFRITIAGGDKSNAVFSAPVSHDGTLGEWQTEASLPTAASVSLVHANEGFLAIGADGSILRSIESASGQGIAHWRAVGSLDAVKGAGVASNGASLLVLGGDDGKSLRSDATLATMNNGLPQDFTHAPALPDGRAFAGAVRLGPYTFVTGGMTATGPTAEVLLGRATQTGGIDGWKSSASLPKALADHATATYGDALYVIGGRSASLEAGVLVAHMNDAGELGAWTEISKLPTERFGACVATSGNRLVVLGGEDAHGLANDVLTATIEADGSLSAWKQIGTLPAGASHLGCSTR